MEHIITVKDFKTIAAMRKFPNPDDPFIVFVENKASPLLLITFTYQGTHFTSTRTAQNIGASALYIRSRPHTWYLESYPHGGTPMEVADTINQFVESRPWIKRIVVTGQSMGDLAHYFTVPG